MRKEISKPIKCKECGRITDIGETKFYCDYCKKEISQESMKQHSFEITIFLMEFDDTEEYDFCGQKCMRKWLLKNESKKLSMMQWRFMTLPFVNSVKELMDLLKD